jgi:hypothetical protein
MHNIHKSAKEEFKIKERDLPAKARARMQNSGSSGIGGSKLNYHPAKKDFMDRCVTIHMVTILCYTIKTSIKVLMNIHQIDVVVATF